MEVQKKDEKVLQWHPAFYASLRIELKEESDNLIFENEHQLGTKPFGIDVLIIKKESEKSIQKNLGRIFRKHNIIEYKSPGDYLSVDDFYKVYGYCCFYKSDTEKENVINIDELTISLVCSGCPRKLFRHLQRERNYKIENVDNGIYYVIGDKIPIQIIVTKDLSGKENLWLRNLTNHLEKTEDAEELIKDYKKNKENNLYESVMNIIVQANRERFEEVKMMCEALEELMKDELKAKREEGERIGKEIGEKIGKEIGEEIGKEIGEKLGKSRINELNKQLAKAGRVDDIIKAAEDREYQERLLEEFGL